MKLQLDENTLNAYINEAIRQELNEDWDWLPFKRRKKSNGGLKWSDVNCKVNFAALGKPKRKKISDGGFNDIENWSKEQLRKWGVEPSSIFYQKTYNALAEGSFGMPKNEEKSLGRQIFDWGLKTTTGFELPGSKNENILLPELFIGTLRKLGYTDRQIHNALLVSWKYTKEEMSSDCPIQVGTFKAGYFSPFKDREIVKKILKNFLSFDDGIKYPEDEPDDNENWDDRGNPEPDNEKTPEKENGDKDEKTFEYPWDEISDDIVRKEIEATRKARQERIAARKRAEQERMRREEELRNNNAQQTNVTPETSQQKSSYDWAAQKTKAYADENPINLKPVVLNKPNGAVTATNAAIKNNNLAKTLQTNKSGDDKQNMNNQYYPDVVINAMTKNINTLPFDKASAGNGALEANAKNVIERSVASGIIDKETGENEIKRISQARKNMEKRR